MPEVTEFVPYNGEDLPMTVLSLNLIAFDEKNLQIVRNVATVLRGQIKPYRNVGAFFSNFSLEETGILLHLAEKAIVKDPVAEKQLFLLTGLFARSEGYTDFDCIETIATMQKNLIFLIMFHAHCKVLKIDPRYSAFSLFDLHWPVLGALSLEDFKTVLYQHGPVALKAKVEQQWKLLQPKK